MVPSPNPLRWDMGAGLVVLTGMCLSHYMDWDRKLRIDGYFVPCHQDKTDEEIYYAMLATKLDMERFRITRELSQPALGNFWEMFKAEWRMWLFPRMEAEQNFKRPRWKPLNEIRPDLYDKTKREQLIYQVELLKKMGQMTQGSSDGGPERVLDGYLKQLREDFADKKTVVTTEDDQPSVEELQVDRADETRRMAGMSEVSRVFYEPKDSIPRAVM